MTKSPNLELVSTKRKRIAELARRAPAMAFMSLAHHIDIHFLHAAYAATRKDGAAGLDGQTAADYAVDLEANLESLLDRFKSGRYKAPPVRRVHIPKGDGLKARPIGIPTFEDKVLQRAVAMMVPRQDDAPAADREEIAASADGDVVRATAIEALRRRRSVVPHAPGHRARGHGGVRRYPWAELDAASVRGRSAGVPTLRGCKRVLAAIHDPGSVERVLRAMGLPHEAPEVASARAPPEGLPWRER
ncbi:MAG: hypothetical protein AB8H80_20500 [Planctomycetota bacterium]